MRSSQIANREQSCRSVAFKWQPSTEEDNSPELAWREKMTSSADRRNHSEWIWSQFNLCFRGDCSVPSCSGIVRKFAARNWVSDDMSKARIFWIITGNVGIETGRGFPPQSGWTATAGRWYYPNSWSHAMNIPRFCCNDIVCLLWV